MDNTFDLTIYSKSELDTSHYINGGLSGMVGIVLSHPFDTIKTNIQSGKVIPRNLYKGILPPLLGVGLEKALVFGTYNNLRDNCNATISGAISGLIASLVVTPIERLKILSQVNGSFRIRELYRGFSATLTREIPGFAIYFTVYERLYSGNNIHTSFLYGALSGACAWIFIYPQDLVKTNVQSSTRKISYIHYVRRIYSNEGLRGFYRGFHLSLMRAIPLHGGCFYTMELLK